MRVLVLGGLGMAGHIVASWLTAQMTCDVWWTHRTFTNDPLAIRLDAANEAELQSAVEQIQPDVVVNCIGVLNQFAERDPFTAILINSLLPHRLRMLGDELGFRLIHISTDCVFSGKSGSYTEASPKDGVGVYAQTKSLGEVTFAPHLTIRTSIIGPELKEAGIGLYHWFMQQHGTVTGFTQVLWNGVTTLELAKFVHDCMLHPKSGVVHLCSTVPVSKHDLLGVIKRVFAKGDVNILPSPTPVVDKTLRCVRRDVTWTVPPYDDMLEELREWMLNHSKGDYRYAI